MPGSMGLETGRAWFCHPSKEGFDSVFERMLRSVILQPILPVYLMPESIIHISVAACDRLLLLCDGTPQLRHAPAAKKNDINK